MIIAKYLWVCFFKALILPRRSSRVPNLNTPNKLWFLFGTSGFVPKMFRMYLLQGWCVELAGILQGWECDWPVHCFGPLIVSSERDLESIPSWYQYNRTDDKKLGCRVCLLSFFWTELVRWMLKGFFNWMHAWQWERKRHFFWET